GHSVVTASPDGTARLWAPGVEDQLRRVPRLPAARFEVRASFSRDGQTILATQEDAVRIWRKGRSVVSIAPGRGARFARAALSPDCRLVVTLGRDGTVRIGQAASGRQLRVLRGGGPPGPGGVTFSPDGTRVLSWSAERG